MLAAFISRLRCGNWEAKRGKLFHLSVFIYLILAANKQLAVPIERASLTSSQKNSAWSVCVYEKGAHIHTKRARTFVRVYLRVRPVNSIFPLNFSHRRALDYIFVRLHPSILFLSFSERARQTWPDEMMFSSKISTPSRRVSRAALWAGAWVLLSPIRFG